MLQLESSRSAASAAGRGKPWHGPAAAFLCLSALALAAAAPAAAQQTADLQDLFRQVLVNPTDAGANMRYAQEAERRGELRKALAAYERIVLNDPGNKQARGEYERIKALLEPARTRFQAGFGGQFETNTDLNDGKGRDDFAFVATFRVDDDRRLGTTLWRSSLQLYGDAHLRSSRADFLYGNASTGPIFLLGNGWRAHTFVTAEAGMADYDFLFHAAGVGATLETRGSDPLRSITAGVSYADFANGRSSGPFSPEKGRDALVLGLSARFGWDNVFARLDSLELRPQLIYNDASRSRFTFAQAGLTASYAIGLATFAGGAGNIFLNPEITAQYRSYEGSDPGRSKDRRDVRLAPALRLIGMYENYTAVLGYMYDRNFSNYNNRAQLAGRDYTNHRIGLNFYVDF